MDVVRKIIELGFNQVIPPENFLRVYSSRAFDDIKRQLIEFVAMDAGFDTPAYYNILRSLANELSPYYPQVSIDQLEVRISKAIMPGLVRMRELDTAFELKDEFLRLLTVLVTLATSQAEIDQKKAMLNQVFKQSALPELLADSTGESLMLGINYFLLMYATAAPADVEDSFKQLGYYVAKHLVHHRTTGLVPVTQEVTYALQGPVDQLRMARDYADALVAYGIILRQLVALMTNSIVGFRPNDHKIIELAGKFGRHWAKPGSQEEDHVVFKHEDLLKFMDEALRQGLLPVAPKG